MQFHYALVDDLMTKEEFERRVEEKMEACGDLVDEPTAAMMVVTELGRHHVKVSALSGKSSLFSFFCKVIAKRPPKEFDRKDGEKGLVAGVFAGDDTGTVQLVLWDEKAAAAQDIEPGEVLEVIGRHAGKSTRDITVMALRKAEIDIPCTIQPGAEPGTPAVPERVDLRVRLIAIDPPRAYSRRDGTAGELVEAVIGDAAGTARLVSWKPELLLPYPPGSSIAIRGAKPRQGTTDREYSIDETASVGLCDDVIEIPVASLSGLEPGKTYSVRGVIFRIFPPRTFTRRDGASSQVRNLILREGEKTVRVVLWAEQAAARLLTGDTIDLYSARAKTGREGDVELHIGKGSAVVVEHPEGEEITFEGTILVTAAGTFIDDGTRRYLVNTELPHGQEVRVTGTLSRDRITPHRVEPVPLDADALAARVEALKQKLGPV